MGRQTTEAVEVYKENFENLGGGDGILIVSGEADPDLFGRICDDLVAANCRGVSVAIIAGPIISSVDGSNPIMDLAERGVVSLYIPTYRQPKDFTVFGSRAVYFPSDELLYGNDVPLQQIVVAKYAYDFRLLIDCFGNDWRYSTENRPILLTQVEIGQMKNSLHSFSFINRRNARKNLAGTPFENLAL